MDMRHEFTVPIGIADAWETFNDLERIAPCFPGAQITSVDGDDFTGLAKVKLGPISLQYNGTGHWNERDSSAYRAVIEAKGKDKRGNGTASAVITAHLEDDGGSATKVVVETDLKITGRPAQFGRGVIQDVGGKLLDQFAQCLATKLGEEPTRAGVTDAVPAGSGATGAAPVGSASAEPAAAATAPVQKSAEPAPAQNPSAEDTPPPAAGDASVAAGGRSDGDPGSPTSSAAPPAPGSTGTPPLSASVGTSPAPGSAGTPSAPGAGAATGSGAPGRPVAPRPLAPPAASPEVELDLGSVILPTLARKAGPTALACLVTAVLTWVVVRRRR